MSTGVVLLLFIAVIALIALAGVLAVYVERNFPSGKYDERQKIARGDAYRFSCWVGMVYYLGLMAYFTFRVGESEWVLEPFLLVTIGILLQLLSFHIYCLITHSALPLGEKPLPTIIGHFVLGGMYLVMYFGQRTPLDTAEAAGYDGALSFNLLSLLIALEFFTFAVTHLIAYLRKEKE